MDPRHDRWASLIEDFAASGLTVERFCEHRDIAASSFYAWKRRLGDRAPLARRKPAFVEAVVGPVAPALGSAAPIIELGCGRRISVPQGFDEATLARLVVLLERLAVTLDRGDRA